MDKAEVVFENIKKRRSCRFFNKKEDVSDDSIGRILDAGRWAPSARNLQPIEFIVVRDVVSREKIAKYCRQSHPFDAPVSVIVTGDLRLAIEVGNVSPHDVTTHFKGLKRFLYMDASAAIQNMLLMAQALDIASLWISSFDDEELDKHLKLPEDMITLAVICFGKPDKDIVVPPKRPLDERVHMEFFSKKEKDMKYIEFSKKINDLY